MKAIEGGLPAGQRCCPALDVAATEIYKDGYYNLAGRAAENAEE